jgi:hypothetical protein
MRIRGPYGYWNGPTGADPIGPRPNEHATAEPPYASIWDYTTTGAEGEEVPAPRIKLAWRDTGDYNEPANPYNIGYNGMGVGHATTAPFQNELIAQWVTDPLTAPVTIGLTFVAALFATAPALNDDREGQYRLQFHLRVVSGDGLTTRGVLWAGSPEGEGETLPQVAHSRWTELVLNPVNALAGDRLVVEVGTCRGSIGDTLGAYIEVWNYVRVQPEETEGDWPLYDPSQIGLPKDIPYWASPPTGDARTIVPGQNNWSQPLDGNTFFAFGVDIPLPSGPAPMSPVPGPSRFYLRGATAGAAFPDDQDPPDGKPGVAPAFAPLWNQATGPLGEPRPRIRLLYYKQNEYAYDHINNAAFTASPDEDVLLAQYITDPLRWPVTIEGGLRGEAFFFAHAPDDTAPDGYRVQVHARVVSRDGTVERGVLYAGDLREQNRYRAFGPGPRAQPIPCGGGQAALTTVAALAGDRIVVEIGARKTASGAPNADPGGATLVPYVAPGADLPPDDNSIVSVSWNGWVEFTTDLLHKPDSYDNGDDGEDTYQPPPTEPGGYTSGELPDAYAPAEGPGSATVLDLIRQFSTAVRRAVRITSATSIEMVPMDTDLPPGYSTGEAATMYHSSRRTTTAGEATLALQQADLSLSVTAELVTNDARLLTSGWHPPYQLPCWGLDRAPVMRVEYAITPETFTGSVDFFFPQPLSVVHR